jgi:predicted deacylase
MNRQPFHDAPARSAAMGEFPVQIAPPDLSPWREGNTGIEGFTQFHGADEGPHVMLLALMHGNEFSGAIALDRLLRAGIAPRCGKLTFGFVNLAAFDRFDPGMPTASRFIDDDLNRIWDSRLLRSSHQSTELARARQILPLVESADILLDLHSMLWPSAPLILCGPAQGGRDLALALPRPELVVADRGHSGGLRLIDHRHFTGPGRTAQAILLEAGQHWQPDAAALAESVARSLLAHAGMIDAEPAEAAPQTARRMATVTHTISAATGQFVFIAPYRGGEVIARRNTLIALDGTAEIRTPYDNCLMVLPSLRASRGHTAVRLARFDETD